VATTAWDLARLLGARPLALAGLDLGYPGRRTHCRGAFFEELSHAAAGRLEPVESLGFRALTEAGVFPVRSNSGGSVLSDRRMIIYRWWFENQLQQHGDAARTFSLAPEGAKIEGMSFREPEELLELPAVRPLIEERLEQARARAAAGEAEGAGRAYETLRLLADDLEKLAVLAERGRVLAAAGAIEALEVLDHRIMKASSRQVAGFLFQPLIHRILDSSGGTGEQALKLSEELYRELESSACYQEALIRESLSRFSSSSLANRRS